MEDWTDDKGVIHRGLIDKEYSSDYVGKFPNAIDKVRLMSPTQFKSTMCEALIEMLNMDLISFTNDYDNKGYLTLFETDEKMVGKIRKDIENKYKNLSKEEINKKVQEELQKSSYIKTKIVKLDPYQEIALSNIDAMKEEINITVSVWGNSNKNKSIELLETLKVKITTTWYESMGVNV